MPAADLIAQCIREKTSISFFYNGLPRRLSPHMLGRREGRLFVFGYQYAGASSKGEIKPGDLGNWRCMELNRMGQLKANDDSWHTARNYNPVQNCIDRVIEQVPQPKNR